jgi:transaldolase
MIKVPATEAGYIAMRELCSQGIPVNATLIFKKEQALSCANAFREGLAKSETEVDTVISVFVSRIDRALDQELTKHGVAASLSGIYNSADIYAEVEKMGVNGCRVLFASTGVKDDSLAPHYYIEKLLAYNSVNTAPVETIKALHLNGNKESALPISPQIIGEHFEKIKEIGIDFNTVLDKQIDDGLKSFKDAFKDILESL